MTGADDFAPELGPMMQALNERQRRFVAALFDVAPGRATQVRAARLAGYGKPASSNKVLTVIASRLMTDERIQLAVEEEGRRRFRALAPLAHQAACKLLSNPKHKDHGKAVLAIIALATPIEARVQHQHQHQHLHLHKSVPRSPADIASATRRIAELAARAGVTLPEPITIEAVAHVAK